MWTTDDYAAQVEDHLYDAATAPASTDESDAVSVVLNPGDVDIRHPDLIRGSHANNPHVGGAA